MPKVVDAYKEVARGAEKATMARWGRACAERVLPSFEAVFPADQRPHLALEALDAWLRGVTPFREVKRAVLAAHAAAREAEGGSAAQFAARSAAQAASAAHSRFHAVGAAWYALKAVRASSGDAEAEQRWQEERLREELARESETKQRG